MENKKSDVSELLLKASETHKERTEVHGHAYDRTGDIYTAFFPNGVTLKTAEDFERFVPFVWCVTKMNRYAENMERGGHKDSAHDLIVYGAILERATEK